MTTITIEDIRAAAAVVDVARAALGDAARAYDKDLAATRDKHIPIVEPLIKDLRTHYDSLIELVRAAPDLFTKPKSIEHSGLRIGFRKGRGSVEFADKDKLVKRIQLLKSLKVLSKAEVDQIVTLKVSVKKSALARLDANVLKRLGVDVIAGQDAAFAEPIDTEVEKLLKQLFGDKDDADE